MSEKDWQVTEEQLKRHNRWCRDPVGVLVRDPGFKIGQEIRDAIREGKWLIMCGRVRHQRKD